MNHLLNQAPAHEMPIAAFYIFSMKRSDEHLDPDGKPTLFCAVELAKSIEDAETILDSVRKMLPDHKHVIKTRAEVESNIATFTARREMAQ